MARKDQYGFGAGLHGAGTQQLRLTTSHERLAQMLILTTLYLERVDIHCVHMNALMTDSMERNALGVCS